LRPEEGISMWDLNKVIGKKLRVDVSALEPLSFEFLD
jgi:sialic acid synthase SpsE